MRMNGYSSRMGWSISRSRYSRRSCKAKSKLAPIRSLLLGIMLSRSMEVGRVAAAAVVSPSRTS